MNVRMINARAFGDGDVVRCARGDYLWGSVHYTEWDLIDLVDHVEPSDYVTERFGGVSDMEPGLERKVAEFLRQRMKRGEWGIWEHPSATFEITGLSRPAMAQLTRHRHLTFDVMSDRYNDMSEIPFDDLFIFPPSFEASVAATRDGEREIDMPADERKARATMLYEEALATYQAFVDAGVPEEDARFLLPQGKATNLRVSGNARALMHLLNVRLNADVQWEAKEAMVKLMNECKEWMPISFRLFDAERPIPLAP